MEHYLFHCLGYLYLYWLIFHLQFRACNSLHPTQPKILSSALVEDTEDSWTQDGAHFRKSVSADVKPEIDTAHSPITPSDMKGAREGQHRTHRQAHSENQVSPALVTTRLDTRSLLIGGERAKLLSVNRRWHLWDWVFPSTNVREAEEDDASTGRKSLLTKFTNALVVRSEKISNSDDYMYRRTSLPSLPIKPMLPKSGEKPHQYRKPRPLWNSLTNSVRYRLRNLSGLRGRYVGQQTLKNMKGPESETKIVEETEISADTESPVTLNFHTALSSESSAMNVSKTFYSTDDNSLTFKDTPVLQKDTRIWEAHSNVDKRSAPDLTLTQSHQKMDYYKRSEITSNPEVHSNNQGKESNLERNSHQASLLKHQDITKESERGNRGFKKNAEHKEKPTRSRRAATLNVDPYVSQNSRARKEGDAIIGALFPLHYPPSLKTAYSRQCSKIREYYGIQRVEVFLMTIERINR
ncbi:metabotropic glutamate receptor 5 [Elysia marginata]|uniref:Metabotropic glutamate receptor 5 n=1 Tax=Elysia marginata TaxID=1093978 RepID=A0AAV4GC84_9GAST|nr:metabotropic glutamate receptor 5 [Elysia marginata]